MASMISIIKSELTLTNLDVIEAFGAVANIKVTGISNNEAPYEKILWSFVFIPPVAGTHAPRI